jgi:uncharacterized protein
MLNRRGVLKALAGLFLSLTGTAAYGGYVVPRGAPRITRYGLMPNGWTPGLKLRIAVLSDLHCGGIHMGLAQIRTIMETANRLDADLILLLGDYVTREDKNVHNLMPDDWAAELAHLRAPLGTFAILGNHEYWDDPEAQKARTGPTLGGTALAKAGISLLQNSVIRLEKQGKPFWLAGIDDQIAFRLGNRKYIGMDDLPGTLAQVTDSAPVILMTHEPDIFVDVPARVSLTLAGHTHGGQLRILGWSPYIPSKFGDRFAYGHIVEENRDLIVSCGLGTSGPPFRLGVPPEVVLVDLGS